jgi:hypothetical protein
MSYKIRSYVNGKSKEGKQFKNYSLTVPNSIAEALPKDIKFVPTMTEEGLLYQPVTGSQEIVKLPKWAQGKNGGKKSEAQDTE